MKKTIQWFAAFCAAFFLYGCITTIIQINQPNVHPTDFQMVAYPILNGFIQIITNLITPIWLIIMAITLSFVYSSEAKKQAKIDADNNAEKVFPCNACNAPISFAAMRRGETIECPVCQQPTVLGVDMVALETCPEPEPQRVKIDPRETVNENFLTDESMREKIEARKKEITNFRLWMELLKSLTVGGLGCSLLAAWWLFVFGVFCIVSIKFVGWILHSTGWSN